MYHLWPFMATILIILSAKRAFSEGAKHAKVPVLLSDRIHSVHSMLYINKLFFNRHRILFLYRIILLLVFILSGNIEITHCADSIHSAADDTETSILNFNGKLEDLHHLVNDNLSDLENLKNGIVSKRLSPNRIDDILQICFQRQETISDNLGEMKVNYASEIASNVPRDRFNMQCDFSRQFESKDLTIKCLLFIVCVGTAYIFLPK